MIKVEFQGKNYIIMSPNKAIEDGTMVLVPKYPLRAGDVYKDPKNKTNDFLFVISIYENSGNLKAYSLLGYCGGCDANSNEFYRSLHTREEIKQYLFEKGMVYSHNISDKIRMLMNNPNLLD